jgi:DNA-directed RNA polymerase specialized sigma24 family protein
MDETSTPPQRRIVLAVSHLSEGMSEASFTATRWSVVLAAGNLGAGPAARKAMDDLARVYWYPLYAFVRRQGHPPTEAEDLVQSFFGRLFEKEVLAAANQSRGRFRSFLLASMKHFLSNEWDKSQAQKRGGHLHIMPLESSDGERRYAAEPADNVTPEHVFERRWALSVLEEVLTRLQHEYETKGQGQLFATLEHGLAGGEKAGHATAAAKLGMSEGAVKVAAHRLRKRYRELLREEISQTVADPCQVDDEIRHLLACL